MLALTINSTGPGSSSQASRYHADGFLGLHRTDTELCFHSPRVGVRFQRTPLCAHRTRLLSISFPSDMFTEAELVALRMGTFLWPMVHIFQFTSHKGPCFLCLLLSFICLEISMQPYQHRVLLFVMLCYVMVCCYYLLNFILTRFICSLKQVDN